MSSTNSRLHEKEQACHQEHERVHIGDYSLTELVVDVDEAKVLHGTTSMQDPIWCIGSHLLCYVGEG
jgi:hypothetical protein